ncbi:MAG: hypothetical protein U0175_30050 [Caldilineaceae bacterium]
MHSLFFHLFLKKRKQADTLLLFVLIAGWGLRAFTEVAFASTPQLSPSVGGIQALTPQLFFPAAYYNFSDAQTSSTWRSTLALQNPSISQGAQVKVDFYTESGQQITPPSLTPIGGIALSNPFTIAPRQTLVFHLEQLSIQSNIRFGVVVSSDQPLAGVHWTRRSSNGQESNGTYEGVAPTSATTVYLPSVTNASNGSSSRLSIQSLVSNGINNVTIKLYGQNGSEAGQTQATLSPYSTWNPVPAMFIPNGFIGTAVVSASGPIAVVDDDYNSNSASLISYAGFSAGATTFYAPELKTGAQQISALFIQNISAQAATVQVANSDHVGDTQIQIAPNGRGVVNYAAGSHNGTFAATISSDQPIVALAAMRFQDGRASVFPAFDKTATQYLFPLFVRGTQTTGLGLSFNSGLSVYNPNSFPVAIQADFGGSYPLINDNLQPGQTQTFASTLLMLPNGYNGTVLISGSGPILVTGSLSGALSSGSDTEASYQAYALNAANPPTPTPQPATPTPSLATATPTPPLPTSTPTPILPTATPSVTPTKGSPTPPPTAPPTATLPPSDATTLVQPGQPATLDFSDPGGGKVTVQLPAGAVTQNTTLLYDDKADLSHPGAFNFAGRTFTLTAYRDNNPQSNFTFQQPVTLVIEYTDGDVAGLNENELTLFFYNTTTNSWSDQGIVVVSRDPANNRITVQISHLTEFAMGTAQRILLPIVRR